jgi:DNA-directed RNA polymerase specialized sigma24 family protein
MLAAVRAIGRFDRRRPFGPWLHRIVVNRSLDRVPTNVSRIAPPGCRP